MEQKPSTRHCIDCQMIICKQYYLKKDLWTGYCRTHRQTVNGYQGCSQLENPEQPEKERQRPKATQLAFDFT